jgi:flagellar FliJ protein
MSKLATIHLALDVAEIRRDEAAKYLASTEQDLAQAKEQILQLEGYVAETDARMVRTGLAMQSMEIVKHQHQFMSRLLQAIALQTVVVRNAEIAHQRAREILVHAEGRVSMTKKIAELRTKEMRALIDRRDQQLTDEMARNMRLRNRQIGEPGEASWQ